MEGNRRVQKDGKKLSPLANFVLSFLLFFLSLFVAMILAEVVLRVATNPIDYLSPNLISDEALGYRIEPHSGKHDSWGFRNRFVPQSAEIVTIGDSQTYGDGATADHAWPSILGRITNRTVYNLSLGGYGPAQFLHLLEQNALKLDPRIVIVALYCGNDFENAYEMVYGYPYWKELRNPQFTAVDTNRLEVKSVVEANRPKFLGFIRGWLRSNSVLYGFLKVQLASITYTVTQEGFIKDPRFTYAIDKDENILIGFKSQMTRRQCNVHDPRIQEGLRITFEIINRMNLICREKGIYFLTILIPTKELVYSHYLEQVQEIVNPEIIRDVISSEISLREMVIEHLSANHIAFLDLLGDMQKRLQEQPIYHFSPNSHPNANGYKAIAEEVAEYLSTLSY